MRGELRLANEKATNMQTHELEIKSQYVANEQELKQSKKMVEWCNEELQRKNNQFTEYRREKSEQLGRLQTQCENLSSEKNSLEVKCVNLQNRIDELETKAQSLIEKNRDFENRKILAEQQFKNEMSSQKKLSDLYKGKSEELVKQNDELEHLVRDLETQLFKMKEEAEVTLGRWNEQYSELKTYSDQKELELERLRSEIELVNKDAATLPAGNDQLGLMSETAVAASKIQKSGKTFTQVYSEYTKLQAELIKERSETARLNECLNHIVAEIEQRGPIIQQTRLDYETAKAENDRLATELAIALNKKSEALAHHNDLKASFEEIKKENSLLEKDVNDLSRQIHSLLRHIEQIAPSKLQSLDRSLVDRLSNNIPNANGNESPAEVLISERLVVFKNIDELQNQNQALRRSLRAVSQKLEALETHQKLEADEKHIKEMEDASKLIEGLQEQLKLQNLNIETYVRERDQWRRIAEGRSASSPKRQSENSQPQATVPVNSEYESMYRDLQRDFDTYRKECGHDTQLLKKELTVIQNEKMELNIQVAKLNNQIAYMNGINF